MQIGGTYKEEQKQEWGDYVPSQRVEPQLGRLRTLEHPLDAGRERKTAQAGAGQGRQAGQSMTLGWGWGHSPATWLHIHSCELWNANLSLGDICVAWAGQHAGLTTWSLPPCTGDGAMGRECGHSMAPGGEVSLCFRCSAEVVGSKLAAGWEAGPRTLRTGYGPVSPSERLLPQLSSSCQKRRTRQSHRGLMAHLPHCLGGCICP